MWPWRELERLRKEIRIFDSKLAACGLAARGYNAGFSHNVYSQSLVAVIALQRRIEQLEKDFALETRVKAIEESDTNLNQAQAASIIDLQRRVKAVENK